MELQIQKFLKICLSAFAITLLIFCSHASATTTQFFTDFTDFTIDGTSVLAGDNLTTFVSGNSQNAALFTVEGVPATFSGGVDGALDLFRQGIRPLYESLPHAWIVSPGGTLTIDFLAPVSEVSFFTLSQSGPKFLTEEFGEISQVQFTNPSATELAALDNLSFTVVPIPAAIWLFATGILGMLTLGRRKKEI